MPHSPWTPLLPKPEPVAGVQLSDNFFFTDYLVAHNPAEFFLHIFEGFLAQLHSKEGRGMPPTKRGVPTHRVYVSPGEVHCPEEGEVPSHGPLQGGCQSLRWGVPHPVFPQEPPLPTYQGGPGRPRGILTTKKSSLSPSGIAYRRFLSVLTKSPKIAQNRMFGRFGERFSVRNGPKNPHIGHTAVEVGDSPRALFGPLGRGGRDRWVGGATGVGRGSGHWGPSCLGRWQDSSAGHGDAVMPCGA